MSCEELTGEDLTESLKKKGDLFSAPSQHDDVPDTLRLTLFSHFLGTLGGGAPQS